jgi:two-component system cell cycle sensor histidine kinase/response regulator CckA
VKSRFHFEDDLWPVEADAGQLGQVFHNLIINACQAMPGGGFVTVEAHNAEIGPSDVLPIAQGRYVLVTVQDQGTGIAEEHLSKIFDPYFTTKQAGSGLGLAVTYSIIRNHNGHISVRSKPGAGTVFTIALPASDRPFAEERTLPEGSPSGSGRVLIMDDEDMVRNVTGAMARELGYEIDFARDGAEAVQKYQQAAEDGMPFDAVIMDLTIPGGMGGKEAVRHLLRLDPRVRAVASSGYSDDPVMADYREHGFCGIIAKPYDTAELGSLLRAVLKAERP